MKSAIPYRKIFYTATGLFIASVVNASDASEALISDYQDAGAGPFSASAGQAAWTKTYSATSNPDTRSCSSCHGTDLHQAGKHIKTGKTLEPMSTSANPSRLTDPDKIEKWFRRNCRWTLGRECTPQEKGDFIRYIKQSQAPTITPPGHSS